LNQSFSDSDQVHYRLEEVSHVVTNIGKFVLSAYYLYYLGLHIVNRSY